MTPHLSERKGGKKDSCFKLKMSCGKNDNVNHIVHLTQHQSTSEAPHRKKMIQAKCTGISRLLFKGLLPASNHHWLCIMKRSQRGQSLKTDRIGMQTVMPPKLWSGAGKIFSPLGCYHLDAGVLLAGV